MKTSTRVAFGLAATLIILSGGTYLLTSGAHVAYAANGSTGSIPKAYGTLKGAADADSLIFEDSSGVIRRVRINQSDFGKVAATISRN